VGRGSGLTGAAASSLRTGAGDETGSTPRFPRALLGRGRGVRSRERDGLRFRSEERFGRLARARDPLAIITAREVMLLLVVEQGSSRLFDYSRDRSGIHRVW
jgi:hypothetical protein